MTLGELVKSVKYAINEECVSSSLRDDSYAENEWKVILHAARHTVSWLARTAPVEFLDGENNYFMKDYTPDAYSNGKMTLPYDFVRLARVRLSGWHKAVSTPISEDSQEYLELADDVACATIDRPVAALVMSHPKKLEVFPATTTWVTGDEMTIIVEPDSLKTALASTLTAENLNIDLHIPPKAESLFVYYTAYLVLRAYRDSEASKMLEVVKTYLE